MGLGLAFRFSSLGLRGSGSAACREDRGQKNTKGSFKGVPLKRGL